MSNYYHPIDPDCLVHIVEWAKEKRVFRDIQHALLCQLWLDTGLSPEELSNLEWKDVDWIKHTVLDIPIRDITRTDFEIWHNIVHQIELKNQLIPQTYIFLMFYDQQFFLTSLYPGKTLTPTSVDRILIDLWVITSEIDAWKNTERIRKKNERLEKRKLKAKPETEKVAREQFVFKRKTRVYPQQNEHKETALTEFARREMEKIAQQKARKIPSKEVYKAAWFFCRICKIYHPLEMFDYTNRWGSEFCRLGRGWRKSKLNLPDHYEYSELPAEVRETYYATRSLA